MRFISTLIALMLLACSACNGQNLNNAMQNHRATSPLLCDPQQAICAPPDSKMDTGASAPNMSAGKKPVQIIYFTDPICSSCWGIEPQLRRLKLEYGHAVDIRYHMGGLLPQWEGFNGGGITKPSDVAAHWDEVSLYYEMPIDGDVWLEDPLSSSYPPSIAFKAAQMQDLNKAVQFLRRIREMVFLEKKNITRWEHLENAAKQVGLDTEKLKSDFEGPARKAFQEDLNLARSLGVRGFPTLFFKDTSGQQLVLYGSKPYSQFEKNVQALFPEVEKMDFETTAAGLFSHYPTLTDKEFSVLSGRSKIESADTLNRLCGQHKAKKVTTKNGAMWVWNK